METEAIKIPALTHASSQYGASMGRNDTHDEESKSSPVVFQLIRLGWVDGDYDSGGAYWGRNPGEHIYRAYSEQIDLYRRAKTFQDAEAQVREEYPLATFEYREDDTEEKLWFSTGSGLIEIALTREQAESVSHSGQCDGDVDALMADPFIARQLEAFKPALVQQELREYGWDVEELADHQANLRRLLWVAGGDIRDSE